MPLDLYTGYFAKLKQYEEAGYFPVSISRFPPKFYKQDTCELLAPSAELLRGYKNGTITDEEYDKTYIEYLQANKASVASALKELANKATAEGKSAVVLLCYEKNGDFCHRHLLAEFLNRTFGTHVREAFTEKEEQIEKE